MTTENCTDFTVFFPRGFNFNAAHNWIHERNFEWPIVLDRLAPEDDRYILEGHTWSKEWRCQ